MSANPLFSEHWYRVKDLRPCLARDIVIRRHVYRNVPCYVLHRESNAAYHRVNDRSFEIIGKLDGSRTLDELWNLAIQRQGEEAPTQADFMSLLAQLHEAELVTVDRLLNAERLFARGAAQTRKEKHQRYTNPLYLRFKLLDPDKLLTVLQPHLQWLFSRVVAAVWIGLIIVGLLELVPRWG